MLSVAGATLVVLLALGWLGARAAGVTLERLADQRGTEAAARAADLVASYIRERHREADRLALNPFIVRAAVDAGRTVSDRQLDRVPPQTLEERFGTSHQLGSEATVQQLVRGYPGGSDLTDVAFTERYGLTVVGSSRPDLFWQGNDPLWQRAVEAGAAETDPIIDSATSSVRVRYAVAIRASEGGRPVGVLTAVYPLDRLGSLLASSTLGDSAYLQLVDEHGNLLFGPDAAESRVVPGDRTLFDPDRPQRHVLSTTRGPELIVSVPAARGRFPANQGTYWILFHQPTTTAYAAAHAVQRSVWLGAVLMFVLIVGLMLGVGRWLNHQVAAPVRAAGGIATRVASGDLSEAESAAGAESGEVGDLMSSVRRMVTALRRLVGTIHGAADESAAMAAEISAATQQMSASTEEMTATTQDLTKRAAEQAHLVRASAEDAGRILQIATALADGAADSVRRSAELTALARHHKGVLDQSVAQLAKLAEEVERGAREAESLATSSAEIQRFVGQAKAVATQTNMLALNAAIEAARAGPQGRGFAVVADEVRKLASLAAAAATETADTVRGVLTSVVATRDRLQRLAQTGAVAREAAQSAAQGLSSVAGEAEANDAWSQEIASSATEVRRLVDEIAARLASVAHGTDGLLASAQEIAASSEQQAASTEEIASSANQLAEAADKLQGAVKSFRLTVDNGARLAPATAGGDVPAPPAVVERSPS